MHASVRTHLSAGVAVVGVGAVALAAVQLPLAQPTLSSHRAAQLAVDLAAAVAPMDPITAITNLFTDTTNNLSALIANAIRGIYVQGKLPTSDNVSQTGYQTGVPLPVPQQMAQNLATYLTEFADFGAVAGQIFANVGSAIQAPFTPGVGLPGTNPINKPPADKIPYNQNLSAVEFGDVTPETKSPPVTPRLAGATLPVLAPDLAASLKPILDFTTTPISGVLVGTLGPLLGPVLATVTSITNAFALLQEGNVVGALTELVNTPINATNAFLNGGPVLDLTPFVGLVGITLPDNVKSLGLKQGGLFSPGGVAGDTLASKAETPILGQGLYTITTYGLPVGPIGSMINTSNYVATAIKVTPPAPAAAAVPAPVSLPAPAPAGEVPAPVVGRPVERGESAPTAVTELDAVEAETAEALEAEAAVEDVAAPEATTEAAAPTDAKERAAVGDSDAGDTGSSRHSRDGRG